MATKRELEERIRQQEEQISELFQIIDALKTAKDDTFKGSSEYQRLIEENKMLRISEKISDQRIKRLEKQLARYQKHPHKSGEIEKTKRGRPPIDEETKRRVHDLRQDDYSMGDISKLLGISKGVVHKILQHP